MHSCSQFVQLWVKYLKKIGRNYEKVDRTKKLLNLVLQNEMFSHYQERKLSIRLYLHPVSRFS